MFGNLRNIFSLANRGESVSPATNQATATSTQPFVEAKRRRGRKRHLMRANSQSSPGKNSEVIPWGVRTLWDSQNFESEENPGLGKTVFIIDSGVSDKTGDLNLNIDLSKSWIENESPFTDGVNHGTHVAGTIAALRNGKGVAGIAAGAEVISLKVISDNGQPAPIESYSQALEYALRIIHENEIDPSSAVINFSMGADASDAIESAVRRVADQGIRVVVSAGNSGVDVDTRSPANAGDHENVFTVGAIDRSGVTPSWTNWDNANDSDVNDIDSYAPGVDILSYDADGDFLTQSGTSMAAAHISGLLLIGDVQNGGVATFSPYMSVDPIVQFSRSGPDHTPSLNGDLKSVMTDVAVVQMSKQDNSSSATPFTFRRKRNPRRIKMKRSKSDNGFEPVIDRPQFSSSSDIDIAPESLYHNRINGSNPNDLIGNAAWLLPMPQPGL